MTEKLHPHQPVTDNPTRSTRPFWVVFSFLLLIGLWSLIVRRANPEYGQFGGYGFSPIIWLGGFAVLPGYVDALLFDPVDGTGDRAVGIIQLVYYLVTMFVLVRKRRNGFKFLWIAYFVSLAINLFNFLYVGLSGL